MTLIVALTLIFCVISAATAFEWAARPEITKRAIAGLWKLTPPIQGPLKEFTVYPKGPPKAKEPELLLMLKEDGSFCQLESQETKVDASWQGFQQRRQLQEKEFLPAIVKGIWDYQEGKLILAAERSKKSPDVLLEGRLLSSIDRSVENSVKTVTANKQQKTTIDTRLYIQHGTVKVGKFVYPTRHPSFFDQPMFGSEKRGGFQLRQILGSASNDAQEEVVEKYRRSDFYNKTFSLTSYPIPTRIPQGRWSIKYNTYMPDPKEAKRLQEEQNRPSSIRVMHVKFFANNTFATVAGTGEAILRGKYDIIGQDRDQFWMQVVRFGFGRSVSGSVYSEGRMLSQDDAKAYWGTIQWDVQNSTAEDVSTASGDAASASNNMSAEDGATKDEKQKPSDKLRVDGSVMFGFGLEPTPVGRFIMREIEEEVVSVLDEDEDDEGDEDEQGEANTRQLLDSIDPGDDSETSSSSSSSTADGVDWSMDGGFQ
jgi:hypothetical protein